MDSLPQNDLNEPSSSDVPPTSTTDPFMETPPPAKPKSRWWVWALAGASVLGLLGCGLCVLVMLPSMSAVTQTEDMVATLNAFLEALDQKDVDGALALVSTRGSRQIDEEALTEMIEGANYSVFEHFESVTIRGLNTQTAANTNPNMPQGVVARINGIVNYSDGYQGSFQAILERENGEWRVFSFNVTAPPEKIQNAGDN